MPWHSHWPLTAETQGWSQASPRRICGVQSDTGTFFLPSTWLFPVSIFPPVEHTHLLMSVTLCNTVTDSCIIFTSCNWACWNISRISWSQVLTAVTCVKMQHGWPCPACCIRNSHLHHSCIVSSTVLKARLFKETKFMLVEGKDKVAPVQAMKAYRG